MALYSSILEVSRSCVAFLQPVRICGGETTGVLREDLNFRGLRMLATITFLLLTFSNYQLWQLPILPTPLFSSHFVPFCLKSKGLQNEVKSLPICIYFSDANKRTQEESQSPRNRHSFHPVFMRLVAMCRSEGAFGHVGYNRWPYFILLSRDFARPA